MRHPSYNNLRRYLAVHSLPRPGSLASHLLNATTPAGIPLSAEFVAKQGWLPKGWLFTQWRDKLISLQLLTIVLDQGHTIIQGVGPRLQKYVDKGYVTQGDYRQDMLNMAARLDKIEQIVREYIGEVDPPVTQEKVDRIMACGTQTKEW
jgi:hypothetical protein